MTINMEREVETDFPFDYQETAERVINAVLDSEKFPYEAEVSVLITDNDGIHEINKMHRGIDSPTDVLSFPMLSYPAPGEFGELEEAADVFNPETGEAMLGDIVLSVDRIRSQAQEYGHSQLREYAFLIAHSMLHLLGYDHVNSKEEAAVMEAKQKQVLEELGITRE